MPSQLPPPSMATMSALEADSYFPLSTLDMPIGEKGGFASLGIDESQFRYSLDMRETGTPTVGIYARDGLWDEEDEEAESSLGDTTVSSSSGGRRTRPPSGTGSTWTSSDKRSMTSKTAGSTKGRSRSGTVTASSAHGHSSMAVSPGPGASPVLPTHEDKSSGGGWSWGRKASGGAGASRSPAVDTKSDHYDKPAKTLKEKRSFSKLIGKGRRGELRVDVNDENKVSTHSTVQRLMTALGHPACTAYAVFFPDVAIGRIPNGIAHAQRDDVARIFHAAQVSRMEAERISDLPLKVVYGAQRRNGQRR